MSDYKEIDDACCPACYRNGENEERQRILNIIDAMNKHTTHSELCLKMHWFAERLTQQIENTDA